MSVPFSESQYATASPPMIVRKAARSKSPHLGPGHPFAEAVKQTLAKERSARIALERELGSLRQELAMLKAELDTAKRLDEIAARLDRVEASRTALRAV